MIKNSLFGLLCCVCCGLIAQTKDVKQSLLVCHADVSPAGQKVFRQKIYAYHFTNGAYTGREELLAFDGKSNGRDYIRTDRGRNTLYKNRYLVTGIGNVLDLSEKKVLFDGKANLVRISNDSAIYYTNDAFKGKFYSVFDFKTKQYAEVKDLLFKARYEQDIEFDKGNVPIKVNLYPQGKPKQEIIADAGYGQRNIRDYKHVPDPPVYWVNDKEFFYGYFNEPGNQVTINRFNLQTLETKSLGTVPAGPASTEARFEKRGNDLHFVCSGSLVYIDPVKNALISPDYCRTQSGFCYSLKADPKGRAIQFKGKEIGHFNFDTENFAPGNNMLAAVKVLTVGDESYQEGLQVWNDLSSSWQKIEAEEVVALLGWINDN